jgi:hypothetical protein
MTTETAPLRDAAQLSEQNKPTERPLGEVLADLWHNFETAVRQELKLASAEVDEKTTRLKRDVTEAVVAGAVLYAGGLAIMAALIMLLAKAIAPWLAALLVGLTMSGAGYALLRRLGRDSSPAPQHVSPQNPSFTQETP